MYNPPRSNNFLVDFLADNKTEIIKINTPMAQGFIASIAAVITTVPNVGRYASTAIIFRSNHLFQLPLYNSHKFCPFYLFRHQIQLLYSLLEGHKHMVKEYNFQNFLI